MRDIYSETEVYHTLEIVGKGTFGKVAKCWRGSDGELVAVKTMKIDQHKNRVIKNELKLIHALTPSALENFNIVQFYEAFRDDTHHYLVFELLQKNLYQYQKENGFRSMAVRNIRTVTCQMLKALAKLKELAIIHADLKPENVMIVDHHNYPFFVKLIDFGSASIFSEVRFVKEPYIQSRFYRSPEILLGLPFCEKVDMWSLGCVMCELFLGWPLYPGDSEHDQVRYICATQGQPHNKLLNAASKANHFFKLHKNSRGENLWQLRPSKRHQSSGNSRGNSGGGGERRKYVLSSLDQLVTLDLGSEMEQGERREECDEDGAAETVDKLSMVELLKRMLTLDSHQRILPTAALKHPFITVSHLGSSPEYRRYRTASCLAYQRACVLEMVQVGDGAGPHPPRAEEGKRFLCQRKAETQPQPAPHDPSQDLVSLHGDDETDYNSQQPPSQTQTPTEQMDELCLMDDNILNPPTGVWAVEADFDPSTPPFTSDISTGLQPRRISSRGPGPACPHPGPVTDHPVLDPANRKEPQSGLTRSLFTRFCDNQHFRQPVARSSRSDPTHGLKGAHGPPQERTGEADGFSDPSAGHPSPPQDPTTPMEQVAPTNQPARHYEGPERFSSVGLCQTPPQEVQVVQYGGPQALPSHCVPFSLPAWALDPEVAPFMTYGPSPHAPASSTGSQHTFLHY